MESYGQAVDGVWQALVMASCTMYANNANRLHTDQRPLFTPQRWKMLTIMVGLKLRLPGVKAHISLGIWEGLRKPLRHKVLEIQ